MPFECNTQLNSTPFLYCVKQLKEVSTILKENERKKKERVPFLAEEERDEDIIDRDVGVHNMLNFFKVGGFQRIGRLLLPDHDSSLRVRVRVLKAISERFFHFLDSFFI